MAYCSICKGEHVLRHGKPKSSGKKRARKAVVGYRKRPRGYRGFAASSTKAKLVEIRSRRASRSPGSAHGGDDNIVVWWDDPVSDGIDMDMNMVTTEFPNTPDGRRRAEAFIAKKRADGSLEKVVR